MASATKPAANDPPAFAERAPWKTFSLGACPWPGMWPFNPSVLRTPDDRWLCSIRCANYHLPGSGVAPKRSAGPIRNRNLMVTLEPGTWRVIRATEMIDEINGIGFAASAEWSRLLSFEDLRLAWTERDGLCAVAAAMRLNGENYSGGTIEQVVLALNVDNYHIVGAEPLRGPWSIGHQKNWSVFQNAPELRLLYSPLGGGVHSRHGRIIEPHEPIELAGEIAPPRPPQGQDFRNGAMDVRITTGHVPPAPSKKRARLALRGGTQLIEIAPDRWLGLAHGCHVGGARKHYWHQTTLHDGNGNLLALSAPYKLAPKIGIEFAAGLACDLERDLAAISFGLEDDSAWLGQTTISGLLETLEPVPTGSSPRSVFEPRSGE